jgi:hypothetical protein
VHKIVGECKLNFPHSRAIIKLETIASLSNVCPKNNFREKGGTKIKAKKTQNVYFIFKIEKK